MGQYQYYKDYYIYNAPGSSLGIDLRVSESYLPASNYVRSLEYINYLFDGVHGESLFDHPQGDPDPFSEYTPKYGRTGLFALMLQEHGPENGPKFVAGICKQYSLAKNFGLMGSVEALNHYFKSKNLDFDILYGNYALSYLYKDLGLGLSEDRTYSQEQARKNVEILEKKGRPKLVSDLDLDIAFNPNMSSKLINKNTDEKNPEYFFDEVKPLSVRLHKIEIPMDKIGVDNNFDFFSQKNLVVTVDYANFIKDGRESPPQLPSLIGIYAKLLSRNFEVDSKAIKRNVVPFEPVPATSSVVDYPKVKSVYTAISPKLGTMSEKTMYVDPNDPLKRYTFYVLISAASSSLGPDYNYKYRLKVHTVSIPQINGFISSSSGTGSTGGAPPDIDKEHLQSERAAIKILGTGFDPLDSWILFESLVENEWITVKAQVEKYKDSGGNAVMDEAGVPLQALTVLVPNHARENSDILSKSGAIYSNRVLNSEVCNMLRNGDAFGIESESQKQCANGRYHF